ncbi:hypothetical protein L2E82_20086 [Cichorium intybus]|uniref:Uncharacterized protein n=1 Tax=Cichorium intybus TaxID=13427 RepID=A0ACB9DS15_CICIN|nr:hypothetical protein L2E82_20086 [Cichorium intybus]
MSFRRTPPFAHSAANSVSKNAYSGNLSSLLQESIQKVPPLIPKRTQLESFLTINCKSSTINLDNASHYFDYMILLQPIPPISSFNQLLNSVSKIKHHKVAIVLYRKMNEAHISPNLITLNIVLNCYCNMNHVDFAFGILGLILKRGFTPDIVTYTSLVDGLFKRNKIIEAVRLFKKFIRLGVRPHVMTYGTLINGLCRAGKVEAAVRLHEDIMNGDIGLAFICVLQKGDVLNAQKLFDEMLLHDITPSSCTYNILLHGLCKNDCVSQALNFLQSLENNGVELDIKGYNSVIDGLCKAGRMETAWDLYTKLDSKGLVPTVVTYTILIHGFCKRGQLTKVDELFMEMVEKGCAPNAVTFNAFMRKFSQSDMAPKVIELLKKMVEKKVVPDASMVSLLLKDEKFRKQLDMAPYPRGNEATRSCLIIWLKWIYMRHASVAWWLLIF